MTKDYKIGDKVKTFFVKKGSTEKIEVEGIIKEIKQEYGKKTYIISGGSVGEFKTRQIS